MDFEDIRSYRDNEVHAALQRIYEQPRFWRAVDFIMPDIPHEALIAQLNQVETTNEFQEKVVYQCLERIQSGVTSSLTQHGLDHLASVPILFITNHRDIILDSALLNKCLVDCGRKTTEIAIGDNLLIEPWIRDLVRLNKSFIVKRAGGIREQLINSTQLSNYIRHDITERNESIWIAQREGRAKDSNDRTQDSLLKMLALSGEGSIPKRLSELNICPVALSYEFDPCDYLKAQEMQQRRDNPNFKKSTDDDLRSMGTGVMGWKGRVNISTSGHISDEIKAIESEITDRKQQVEAIAKIIDKHIHQNYVIYPINYVALDLLNGNDDMAIHYTAVEKEQVLNYFNKKLSMIALKDKDEEFLRTKMLEMYANPLRNYLASKEND